MKTTQILFIGAAFTLAAAQTFQSLPDCGKLCVNNMLAKAKELGCADGDAACLCSKVDFSYGVRDCSIDVCGAQQIAPIIAYTESYCKAASPGSGNNNSTNAGPIVPPTSSSLVPISTILSKPGQGTPIATSALVSLVTSGGEVYTSTFSLTTLFSSGATPSASITQISSQSSKSSTIEPSSTSTTESSSSSTGSGAKPTAFAGLAAAAGLAAMIL